LTTSKQQHWVEISYDKRLRKSETEEDNSGGPLAKTRVPRQTDATKQQGKTNREAAGTAASEKIGRSRKPVPCIFRGTGEAWTQSVKTKSVLCRIMGLQLRATRKTNYDTPRKRTKKRKVSRERDRNSLLIRIKSCGNQKKRRGGLYGSKGFIHGRSLSG